MGEKGDKGEKLKSHGEEYRNDKVGGILKASVISFSTLCLYVL